VVAFGRDPYFPPWNDTAQLDFTDPGLRRHMIDTLKWISDHADGVRCDMAMLVLRDYIRRQWYPLAAEAWFDERMPGEFWAEAITEVKRARPDFKFIAEAYWDKEEYLVELGFDLAYEKKTLDGLVHHNHQLVVERLLRPAKDLAHSLFFIENHDEERAAVAFDPQRNLAAAALTLALPGSKLIHEGQMEGRRERFPVQRIRPLMNETPDLVLRQSYGELLKVTAAEVFDRGAFYPFDSGAACVVSFFRQYKDRTVGYVGLIGDRAESLSSIELDISPIARYAGAQHRLRLTDLLTSNSATVEPSHGAFRMNPEALGLNPSARFFLVEARAAN